MLQLLLFLVCCGITLVEAYCDDATLEKVKDCYRPYLAGFNVTMADRLPEFWSFHNLRASYVFHGETAALRHFCQLGTTLISCVRQFSCLEYHDYPQLGPENANTSTSYYKDLNITQYQCGPGYESEFGKGTLLQARHTAKLPDQDFIFHYSGLSVMESEMTCIGDSRGNRSQEVQACDEAYMKNYHKLGMCKAEQILLDCQTAIPQKDCDYNSGIFVCNCVLAAFNSIEPVCYTSNEVRCPLPKISDSLKKNGIYPTDGLFF